MLTTTTVQLDEAAAELLQALPDQRSGRLARTLTPGAHAPLKQTLIALEAEHHLQDHRAPGHATIQVLVGHVRLTVGDDEVELAAGTWATIPPQVHGLAADEDSVALLTVASTVPDAAGAQEADR